MTSPLIQFENVNKWFGTFHALRDIHLHVQRGERIVICGPSGSGKSTLLRCINRLEEHQEGKITVMGIELTDDLKSIERIRRQVGMVFQQFNLFPHLRQQQRVAIARALCLTPEILLFDEPTSALDPEMVQEVLDVMTSLAKQGTTMLCVTHEMHFARAVADRVIFMDEGQIIEEAPPTAFFDDAQHPRTQTFLKRLVA